MKVRTGRCSISVGVNTTEIIILKKQEKVVMCKSALLIRKKFLLVQSKSYPTLKIYSTQVILQKIELQPKYDNKKTTYRQSIYCHFCHFQAIIKIFCKIAQNYQNTVKLFVALREKCPNMEFSLVHIFLYLDWIRRFSE